jgi:hypothetical protein
VRTNWVSGRHDEPLGRRSLVHVWANILMHFLGQLGDPAMARIEWEVTALGNGVAEQSGDLSGLEVDGNEPGGGQPPNSSLISRLSAASTLWSP